LNNVRESKNPVNYKSGLDSDRLLRELQEYVPIKIRISSPTSTIDRFWLYMARTSIFPRHDRICLFSSYEIMADLGFVALT